jgi:hypothetical protein
VDATPITDDHDEEIGLIEEPSPQMLAFPRQIRTEEEFEKARTFGPIPEGKIRVYYIHQDFLRDNEVSVGRVMSRMIPNNNHLVIVMPKYWGAPSEENRVHDDLGVHDCPVENTLSILYGWHHEIREIKKGISYTWCRVFLRS